MSFIDRIKSELEVQTAARELCYDALKKMPQGRLITKCRSNSNPEHYLRLSASVPLQYLGSNDKDLIKLLQQKREFENQLKALPVPEYMWTKTDRKLLFTLILLFPLLKMSL